MQVFRVAHGRDALVVLATFLLLTLWLRGQVLVAGLWHNVGWVWLSQTADADLPMWAEGAKRFHWLQQGASYFPQDTAIWRALGFARVRQGDEMGAVAAWQHVWGMENELLAWSQEALRQGRVEEAKTWLYRAQAVAPDSAFVWYYWGLFHVGQEDHEAAATAFHTAFSAQGASELISSLDVQTGLLLLAVEDSVHTDSASSLFSAAIAADAFVQPWEKVEAYYQLGDASYRAGEFVEARSQFEQVLNLEPTHYRASVRLAESIWQVDGNWLTVQPLLEKAIALRPDNKWAYKVLAAVMVDSRQPDNAARLYRQVLQLDDSDQTALDFLAQFQEP